MFFNALIIAIYVIAIVLADVPSAILFAGLDTFKSLIASGATLEGALPLLVRMVCTAATGHIALFAIAALQTKFLLLAEVPALVTFSVIICAQPVVQLFLRVIPAQNLLGFSLGWVSNPAARDPMLWAALAIMLLGLISTTVVLQKYSA
jgi:hypothetical protein